MQPTFHKDEGGKANVLMFRFTMHGPAPTAYADDKGEIKLDVVPVFADTGAVLPLEMAKDMLELRGSTEKPSPYQPFFSVITMLGGVQYRLLKVSKHLGGRRIAVQVSLRGCDHVAPLRSDGTLVFSKRKDVDSRRAEQQREREDLEARERHAARALAVQDTHRAYTPVSGGKRSRAGGGDSDDAIAAADEDEDVGDSSGGEDDGSAATPSLERVMQELKRLRRRVHFLERRVGGSRSLGGPTGSAGAASTTALASAASAAAGGGVGIGAGPLMLAPQASKTLRTTSSAWGFLGGPPSWSPEQEGATSHAAVESLMTMHHQQSAGSGFPSSLVGPPTSLQRDTSSDTASMPPPEAMRRDFSGGSFGGGSDGGPLLLLRGVTDALPLSMVGSPPSTAVPMTAPGTAHSSSSSAKAAGAASTARTTTNS